MYRNKLGFSWLLGFARYIMLHFSITIKVSTLCCNSWRSFIFRKMLLLSVHLRFSMYSSIFNIKVWWMIYRYILRKLLTVPWAPFELIASFVGWFPVTSEINHLGLYYLAPISVCFVSYYDTCIFYTITTNPSNDL